MNKVFLFFLLCFFPLTLSAQRTISGRITDAADSAPITGASVFIANTTAGVSTDADGYYQLKIPGEGSYQLVVSHVGYQSVFHDIEPGRTSQTFHAALQAQEIEEITVAVKVSARKNDVDLFWQKILGKKPSKKTIQALNPDDVFFYFNSETQKLTVTSRVPLQIVNYETGYHIQCVLDHFTHDYTADLSSWQFQPMFTELEPVNLKQKLLWEKNRKNVYQVSIVNFIKSLYQNTLFENGFLLANEIRQSNNIPKFFWADPKYFLSSESLAPSKVLKPDGELILFSYGKPITGNKELEVLNGTRPIEKIGLFRHRIIVPDGSVSIFPDGTYKNSIQWVRAFSSNSISGLNMLLPAEYHSDGETESTNAYVENVQDDAQDIDPLAASLLDVSKRFDSQLTVFPQEKVHLHTDKPYYLSGERIWFRAHVVDAATHVPSFSSGSVYVELFNAKDSVVSRIKTGVGNDLYSGYIPIPEDAPEGDYTLRACTAGMRTLDEDYFFLKNIRIGDPMSRIMQVHPEFQFLPDQKIGAAFHFSSLRPFAPSPLRPFTPESLKITVNNEKPVHLKTVDGKSGISFHLASKEKQRVMLLDAMYEKIPFRQYIKIPLPDDDFDVSFYPEGGSALYGVAGRVAFKAMQRDGTEIDVEGTVYDSQGNGIGQFKTGARGMGSLTLQPERGETYYAVCTNGKGQSKRFELPAAKEAGYALSATWSANRLMVNIIQPESQKAGDTLCLIVHTRGVVQDAIIWENTNEPVIFSKDFFPSGVSHLLLLTKEMTPVSERLVFVQNDDQAKVVAKTDKDSYPVKSPVEYTVKITDESGEPLLGNFSVSVTDNHTVASDSTSNILTSLLLTSDLRGNLPDPGYFFRNKGRPSEYALDLLMLTQGWRRYDKKRIVKNDLMFPDTLLTRKYGLSGTVRTHLLQRSVENANVSILSLGGDFAQNTITDRNGRFYVPDGETPDSTWLIVQTAQKSGIQDLELLLDEASYPERTIPVVANGIPDRIQFAQYADKEEQRYVDEYGTRISHIPEVVIKAKKIGKEYSQFYQPKDVHYVITEDDLKKFPPASTEFLLRRIPGIIVDNGLITYRRELVAVMIDDFEGSLEGTAPSNIIQVDFLERPVGFLSGYTISISTKSRKPKETPYIKYFMPLGFQRPAEFYAPKYETPVRNTQPDLRTTIHWEPNITTDEEGKASVNFYTASATTTYTVVVEGVTEDGKIIYHRDEIVVND